MDLHPIAIATLEAIAASGQLPYHNATPQEARADVAARLRALPQRSHPDITQIIDDSFDGPDGPIGIRRYEPRDQIGTGVIVYAHGGGWVMGAPDMFDPLCCWLAVAARQPVVSIDYRLAPETRFPGALEDMCAAVTALGQGPDSVIVAGDSAGGNLAAAAALKFRDHRDPTIAGQILLYPVLDHDFSTDSYLTHGPAGRIISTDDMRWFWDQYAPSDGDRKNPYASPLREPDFTGLPPAFIVVAGWDPLHDEGVAYARRLADACIEVVLEDLGDMMHGFCSQAGLLDRADMVLAHAGKWAGAWLDLSR